MVCIRHRVSIFNDRSFPVSKIAKKQSERVRVLLIRHSKYNAILSKYTPTDCSTLD